MCLTRRQAARGAPKRAGVAPLLGSDPRALIQQQDDHCPALTITVPSGCRPLFLLQCVVGGGVRSAQPNAPGHMLVCPAFRCYHIPFDAAVRARCSEQHCAFRCNRMEQIMRRVLFVLSLLFAVSSSALAQQGIHSIQGKWSSDVTGEPVFLTPAFNGWDAWISWAGQASITTTGHRGAHIKIEGQDRSITCYYYVSLNNPTQLNGKMTWSLRAGGERCPPTSTFSRVQ
ncbi:hypothetical protein ABIF90_003719 [Bradyrhizobium japonicum]